MPLTPEQQQELQELEELEQLEKKFGQSPEANGVTTAAGAFGRIAQPVVLPTQEDIDNPNSPLNSKIKEISDRLEPGSPWREEAAISAGSGGAQLAAGEGLAGIAKLLGKGSTKVGDVLMQRSVGIKKAVPGVGTTLADEGIVGTKGMMRNQLEKGLETRGQQIGEIAKGIPQVSTKPVAEKLGGKAARMTSPSGDVLAENMPAYRRYLQEANKISSEGTISGSEAAFRRAQYGKIARDAGRYRDNPAQGIKAQIAGEQQAGYSQALKNVGGPELIEADKAYSALSSGLGSISRPESISTMSLIGKTVPAMIGGAAGGVPGALAGAAASTPLVQSAAGQLATKTGQGLVSPITQGTLKYTPLTLEELLGKKH